MRKSEVGFWIWMGFVFIGGANCAAQELEEIPLKLPPQNPIKQKTKKFLVNMTVKEIFPDRSVRKLAVLAAQGDVQAIEKILRNSSVSVDGRGVHGATALYWAARNFEGFRCLLEHGADPNIVYDDGSTILSLAAQAIDQRILEVALAHGADPELKETGNGFRGTPLHTAAMHGTTGHLDQLVNAGANLESLDRDGMTPLLAAASSMSFANAEHLLSLGANPAAESRMGVTLPKIIANFATPRWMNMSDIDSLRRIEQLLKDRGISVRPEQQDERSAVPRPRSPH